MWIPAQFTTFRFRTIIQKQSGKEELQTSWRKLMTTDWPHRCFPTKRPINHFGGKFNFRKHFHFRWFLIENNWYMSERGFKTCSIENSAPILYSLYVLNITYNMCLSEGYIIKWIFRKKGNLMWKNLLHHDIIIHFPISNDFFHTDAINEFLI